MNIKETRDLFDDIANNTSRLDSQIEAEFVHRWPSLAKHITDLEAENTRLREDKTDLVMSSLNLITATGKAERKNDINHPVLKLCKKHMQETLDNALSKDDVSRET